MRFKLTIEYDGTRYSGWQFQKDARTIQGELQKAIGEAAETTTFELYGSGRTDAGVHALGQVAHLDITTKLDAFKLRLGINDRLPHDIHVLKIEKAGPKFHARHDAIARSYLYQISRRRTAFGKKAVWWIKDELEIQKMRSAATLFLGLKDFRNFTAKDPEGESTKVELQEIALSESGSLILIRIVGSHFLWKMVRQIVGVLAEVGRGRLSADAVARMFKERSDLTARLTAPPSGLFLEKVYYPNETRLSTMDPTLRIV